MESKFLYSEQSENMLLGLLVFNGELIKKISGLIESDDFYFKDNQLLFKAIQQSLVKHEQADIPFLIEELSILSTKEKKDWMAILANLINERGIEANIEKYVELIKEKKQHRLLKETLTSSTEMINNGGESVTSLINHVENRIQNITRQKELKNFEGIDSLTNEFVIKMKKIQEDGIQIGIKTGFPDLYRKIGGMQDGQFIIIAARPSMGKTAVSLEIAKNVAKNKKHVGFFSLEMPRDQLIKRMLSSESLIESRKLFNPTNRLNQQESTKLEIALDTIQSMKMWIDDSASLKMSELAWKARKAKESIGLDLIIIDYLQLIDGDGSNSNDSRQQIISDISRNLKSLARELEIPIVALSQLSRKVESREDKRPMLSDIRESGAVEQDADIIMFLFRDDYYKKPEERASQLISNLEVIIGKNRNGEVGSINMGIDLQHSKIITSQYTQTKNKF